MALPDDWGSPKRHDSGFVQPLSRHYGGTDFSPSPKKRRTWPRDVVANRLTEFERIQGLGDSQRVASELLSVPRTTLTHWKKRKDKQNPALADFFESAAGVGLLHRIEKAAHLAMTGVGPCGIRTVMLFFELSGLDQFIASSFGSQHKVSCATTKAIVEFGEEERARLGASMPKKTISLAEDETFHPATCLVAIEPASNFILVEKYSPDRSAKSWDEAVDTALKGLPVKVVQVVSDEAKGLIAHTEKSLGAHHSSDLFHCQHEITKAMSPALAKQERHARKRLERLAAKAESVECCAATELDEARAEHVAAVTRQEKANRAMRGIGQAYHPYDLETGSAVTAENLGGRLEEHFAALNEVVTEAELSARSRKGVEKAQRVSENFVATIAFVTSFITSRLAGFSASPELKEALRLRVIPGLYLRRVANKARLAEEREILLERSSKFLEILYARDGPFTGITQESMQALLREAQTCADLFQRSSSCVEGRNGQLSLRHHSLHSLPPEKLEALTVLHNFFLKRDDKTTAAERFFEAAPRDLFEHLLARLPFPARPAKKRRKDPNTKREAA